MTGVDLAVLGILAGSTVLGLMRGLVREAFSLAAWVLAFLGAKFLAPLLAPSLPGGDAPALQHAAALVLVFLAVLIVASLAGKLLSGLVKWAGLGAYDHMLGGLFGVLRAGVAVLGLALVAGLTALPKSQVWQQALVRGPLEQATAKIQPWLPKDLAALIRF